MRDFLKSFMIYGVTSIFPKLIGLFLMPFYTNTFSQKEYGVIAIIASCMGIIDLTSNLNIHSGVAREYYEYNEGKERKMLLSTGFASIVFFSLVTFLIIYLFRSYLVNSVLEIKGYELAFFVMLLTIPSGSLFSYFSILMTFEKNKWAFLKGVLIQLIVQTSVTISLITIWNYGIEAFFIGILAGQSLGLLFYYHVIIKKYIILYFNTEILKKILIYSIPLLPAILSGWIDSSLGQILIAKYISINDAGIYSVALRIASVFLVLNAAFSNVWTPHLFKIIKKTNYQKDLMKLFNGVLFILFFISLNICIFSDLIVSLLSNDTYIQAANYLCILTIPMSLILLNNFARIGPQIVYKTGWISISSILGSFINVLFLYLFLPRIGVIAVPICLSIGTLFSFSFSVFMTRKLISIEFPITRLVLFFATITLVIFVKLISKSNSTLFLIFGLVTDIVTISYFLRIYYSNILAEIRILKYSISKVN